MTLLEVVVILAVLATLVALLVPSMVSYINSARSSRARADTRTIGNALIAFYRDTGFFPKTSDSSQGHPGQKTIDLLVSPGAIPSANSAEAQGWLSTNTDDISHQIINNTAGYTVKGPNDGMGWNGPYITSGLESDPWGNRFMINVTYLDASPGITNSVGDVKRSVFVLSSGPDGVVQTPYDQPVTAATVEGDDIGFRLQ